MAPSVLHVSHIYEPTDFGPRLHAGLAAVAVIVRPLRLARAGVAGPVRALADQQFTLQAGVWTLRASSLLADKVRWIRVTRRFYGFVLAAAMGLLLLAAANLLFAVFASGGPGFCGSNLGSLSASSLAPASWPPTAGRCRREHES